MNILSANKETIETEYKEKIIGILTVLFPKAKVYLFGSRARGTVSKISDIDLAIDNGQKILPIGLLAEARDMLNASNIPYKIEIVDFYSVSTLMQNQINQDGIIWKK